MAFRSRRAYLALGTLFSGLGGCAMQNPNPQPEESDLVSLQSALTAADCGRTLKCDESAMVHEDEASEDWGRWPGGYIRYTYETGFPEADKPMVDNAMKDWERISGGVVHFLPPPNAWANHLPVVTVKSPSNGVALTQCYRDCRDSSGCGAALATDVVYHELGHTIGFPHQWQRFDTTHYLQHWEPTCGDAQSYHRWKGPLLDYGPFNALSVMDYNSGFPDITFRDGSSLAPGTACGALDVVEGSACPPGDTRPIVCSTCGSRDWIPDMANNLCTVGSRFPIRLAEGLPTKEDGAAVAELYRNLFDPGWRKFIRTVDTAPDGMPYNYNLKTGVTIPSDSTPAISYRPVKSGVLTSPVRDIFARGTDNRIYQKTMSASGSFSEWDPRGMPNGATFITDPSAVSWDGGRIDLAATSGINQAAGGAVWISSFNGSTWGSWQSLGKPASTGFASAPSITSWGPNRLDVFVRGLDNKIYTKSCTAGCTGGNVGWNSNWTPIGGTTIFLGRPVVVSRTSGAIDLVAMNNVGEIRRASNADSYASWTTVPFVAPTVVYPASTATTAPIGVGSHLADSFDLYVRGNDDKVWWAQCPATGACGSFSAIGGVTTAPPASQTKGWNDRVTYVAVTMPERQATSVVSNGVWVKQFDDTHMNARHIATTSHADGRLEVVYNGVGDVMYRKDQPYWHNDLVHQRIDPGNKAKELAVGRFQGGKLTVVYTDGFDNMYWALQGVPGGKYGAANAFGVKAKKLALTQAPSLPMILIYIGNDDVLYLVRGSSQDGSWGTPTPLVSSTTKAKRFVLERDSQGRVHVVFTDLNDVIYQTRESTLSWYTPTPVVNTSTKAKELAMAMNVGASNGKLELVYTALDDVIYHTVQSSPGTSPWATPALLNASYNKAKQIALGRNQDGRLEAFYTIMDDFIRHTWQNSAGGSSWSGEFDLRGTPKATYFTVGGNSDGRLELFYNGMDDVLYHQWQESPNSEWSLPDRL